MKYHVIDGDDVEGVKDRTVSETSERGESLELFVVVE